MNEQQGTTATINVLDLAFTAAELVAEEIAGDGLQWSDAVRILTSSEFQQKFAQVLTGYSRLPGEIKNLSDSRALRLPSMRWLAPKESS